MILGRLCKFLVLAPLFAAPVMAGEAGEQLFVDSCSGCHQVGGIGSPGLAPPLVDPALWTGLGQDAPRYLAGVLLGGLSGKITAMGSDYVGLVMPPQDWMSDAELKAVADYVLNDLNGLDVTVDEALVAETRAAVPSHGDLRTVRKTALP